MPAMRPGIEIRLVRVLAGFFLLASGALTVAQETAGFPPIEPPQATWDQLMNGSLDSRVVDIRGIIEGLYNRKNGWTRVDFRVRDGEFRIELRRAGIKNGPLEQYENAVIRVRGKFFADRYPDGRVKSGQARMHDAEIMVDQPAPADVFALPTRKAASLVRSDPDYDPFRQIKVSGQVLFIRGWDYFMVDGLDGLRFTLKGPTDLEVGDLVEVVGFSAELNAAAPVLRGAVARKIGHAALPEPLKLSAEDLVKPSFDAKRVQVDALLASIRQTPTNLVMEMQAGSWRFLARLTAEQGGIPELRLGSQLELTGVYCAQGGYKALGEDVAAVDLLLNSPGDIKILAQPSWWTLPKLLVVVSVLVAVLMLAVLWITQLHRQVEERSAALEAQIQQRQRIEQKHALEQERARIAQDLHDQLGSDITEISMLAARAKSTAAVEGNRRQYLDQLGEKSRRMIAALDEIVWAMNPAHDSLASVISYFCLYADRFLSLANIRWRLENTPAQSDECIVDSRQRHQLFLAFKEALTNIVRHSHATEVLLEVQLENHELQLTVADNGRGLPLEERTDEMDGVANMRARMEKLGGRFEISSGSASGTTLKFALPHSGQPPPSNGASKTVVAEVKAGPSRTTANEKNSRAEKLLEMNSKS